ncbi:unnamed protein product, partial [Staurois parvus]
MCPLQRPRPSPPADAGIRLSCVPVPVTSGRRMGAGGGRKFENFLKMSFFSKRFYICFVLSPVCILTVLS